MSTVEQDRLLQRLKRIEGQIQGLQRMITEEQPCSSPDPAAARAALAGRYWSSNALKSCIEQASGRK